MEYTSYNTEDLRADLRRRGGSG